MQRFVLVDGVEYAPGELGDYGVAESSNSVHPVGYPIIHSTNRGFICPFIPDVNMMPDSPSRSFCEGGRLEFCESLVVGVGSIFLAQVLRPSPLFSDSPFRLLLPLTVGVGMRAAAVLKSIPPFPCNPVPLPSDVRGVGSIAHAWVLPWLSGSPHLFALTVGNKPNSLSFVGCSNTCSRYSKRLYLIPFFFKIFTDCCDKHFCLSYVYCLIMVNCIVAYNRSVFHDREYIPVCAAPIFHADDSSNIFTKHPSGLDVSNDFAHLRPEVTVVVSAKSFSCKAKSLAWESAGKNVNCAAPGGGVEVADVGVACDMGEVFGEDALARWVYFDLEDVFPAGPLGGEVEASDA